MKQVCHMREAYVEGLDIGARIMLQSVFTSERYLKLHVFINVTTLQSSIYITHHFT